MNFAKIVVTPFLTEHFYWLPLELVEYYGKLYANLEKKQQVVTKELTSMKRIKDNNGKISN